MWIIGIETSLVAQEVVGLKVVRVVFSSIRRAAEAKDRSDLPAVDVIVEGVAACNRSYQTVW